MISILFLSVTLSACALVDVENNDERASHIEPLHTHPIEIMDFGSWSHTHGCSAGCVWSSHFWVDLAVRNDAYDKHVVVEWSTDGFETVREAPANHEESLGNGYEQWGVDIELGLFSTGVHARGGRARRAIPGGLTLLDEEPR